MDSAPTMSPETLYLQVYESSFEPEEDHEAWKGDHLALKRNLWKFEDKLACGLNLLDALQENYSKWCDRVRSGEEDYRNEDGEAFRLLFESWLRPCDKVDRQLARLEATYGALERGKEFRRRCEEVRLLLAVWNPPTGPAVRAPAHTTRVLCDDEIAGELRKATRPAADSVPLRHKVDCSRVF